MTKNILYVASSSQIIPNQRLPSAKIGITSSQADKRIRQLNSTKMPIKVELVGAWSFEDADVSAEDAEKAAHYLLEPYNVNGEWFQDPDEDLADRVGQFAKRLGGRHADDGTDAELSQLTESQSKARADMEAIFEPLAAELDRHSINWEYMTWKVGMDSPFGRLNISVRASGGLYLRMRCSEYNAAQISKRTPINWKDGEGTVRLARNITPHQLLEYVTQN